MSKPEKAAESENYVNGPEIPMGLGMALAKDLHAMERFSALSDLQKQQVIAHTHTIGSKKEMEEYVRSLFGDGNG